MKIRLAEKEDAPAIMALLLQIANLHVGLRPDLFVPDVPKYDEKELLGMLGNEERPIYVAEKDGVVVAHLFCQSKILGTTKRKIFYLDDLCVDEKCRHQGIGTALFAFFKEEAKRRGCYAISLNCWTGNEEAASFYKKMGMGVRSETLELILK